MADKELSKKDIVHIWMEKDEADKVIYQRAMDICHLFEEKKQAVYFQYDDDKKKFTPGFFTFYRWSSYSLVSFNLLDLSKDEYHEEEITEDNSTLVVKVNFSDYDKEEIFTTFFIPFDDFCRPDWNEYLSTLLDEEIKKCEERQDNRKTLADLMKEREYSEYLRLKEIYETN